MAAPKKTVPPVDKDVKIPAAVLAASKRPDEVHKAAYSTEDPAPEPAPIAQDPTAPQPEPAPIAPPAASPPLAAPVPVADETWEHKFNSMKGRWERSETINRALNERITNLEATMATMAAAPVDTPAPKTLVTQAEITEYGAEFLDVVGRRAAEAVTPEVAELKLKLEQLENRVGNVGQHIAKDARTKMHDLLNQHAPNWKEINNNENFLEWLALPDAYSGVIRHALLKDSYAANDGPRVLAFFKGFLAEEAAKAPQTPKPDPAAPTPPATKVPLETFAAPGRAKSAATPPVPPEKPTISRADVTQFYSDLARGVYRGRDEEKARIEAMIFEANRDGRII